MLSFEQRSVLEKMILGGQMLSNEWKIPNHIIDREPPVFSIHWFLADTVDRQENNMHHLEWHFCRKS